MNKTSESQIVCYLSVGACETNQPLMFLQILHPAYIFYTAEVRTKVILATPAMKLLFLHQTSLVSAIYHEVFIDVP